MADNVAISAGTGTTIATDDVGGVQHQRMKLSLGADGTAVDAVAGAGAVGTGVQRVTLASDDPAVTQVTKLPVAQGSTTSGQSGPLVQGAVTTAAPAYTTAQTKPLSITTGGSLRVEVTNANANGSAADSASTSVAFSTEGKAQIGSLTETAPASDTASSGLNGRLQRIAQRITSLIALIPASLGAKAAGASLSVTQGGYEYELVAASATNQAIGATGATGDYLSHVNVQPTSTTVGVVTILDNAVQVHAYPGGTVGDDLKPFTIPISALSVSGAWKITTGAGVKCVAFGDFT